jgi:hypothetical protein
MLVHFSALKNLQIKDKEGRDVLCCGARCRVGCHI